jgi:hypothetical protein
MGAGAMVPIRSLLKSGSALGLVLCLLCLVISCDQLVELPVNGEPISWTAHFDCGEVTVRAQAVHRRAFFIEQECDVDENTWIYPDSIAVIYKDQLIDHVLTESGKEIKATEFGMDDPTTLHMRFNLGTYAAQGDTVKIAAGGFIYCEGKPASIDTIRIRVE